VVHPSYDGGPRYRSVDEAKRQMKDLIKRNKSMVEEARER
jgi:hypothetical protein